MTRRAAVRHAPDTPPAVRAQADLAIAALVDLPPRYGFVIVITDTRDDHGHIYYSDLTTDSAAIVLRDVSDALTPSTDMEN